MPLAYPQPINTPFASAFPRRMKKINTVFMGSPPAALPSLHALHALSTVVLVIAPPPRRAGRGKQLQACAVHQAAQTLGLQVAHIQHAKQALPLLTAHQAALGVVCAYGRILPQSVLDAPALGMYNLHFSLLPRWRGASPVQAALLAGDTHSGVCLQRMVSTLDAGPLVGSSACLGLAPEEDAQQLTTRLSREAASLLKTCWPRLARGEAVLTPQVEEQATFCRIIAKHAGALDFAQEDAVRILRKLRAYVPWPGCYCFAGRKRLRILEAQMVAEGDLRAQAKGWAVGQFQPNGMISTPQGVLQIRRIQSTGGRALAWSDFIRGNAWVLGVPLAAK